MQCLPCPTVAAVSLMQGVYTHILTYRTSAIGGGSALSGASIEGQPTAFNFCNTNPASAFPHGMHQISPQQLSVQLSDCEITAWVGTDRTHGVLDKDIGGMLLTARASWHFAANHCEGGFQHEQKSHFVVRNMLFLSVLSICSGCKCLCKLHL